MEDAGIPGTDAQGEPASDASVAAIAREALSTLSSTNEAAVSVILTRAEDGTLAGHMPDGALKALADELIQTCEETADED